MTTTDDARRMGDPQDPRVLAMIARDRMVDENMPQVIPACPSWCTLPADHPYDGAFGREGEPAYERDHVAYRGPSLAEVSMSERNYGGSLAIAEPAVYLSVDNFIRYDLEQIRTLAAELLEAAAVLERISAPHNR